MSLPPTHYPNWPKVTRFDDPDEEARVAAMREALRAGTFDEAEPTLGTPPGFATLLTDPPRVARRYDSHGLESEDDGSGPFDGLKRYAALRTGHAQALDQAAGAPAPSTESDGSAGAFDALKRFASLEARAPRVVTVYIENPAVLARQGRDPLPLSPDRGGGRRR